MYPPKTIAYNWHVQSDYYELTASGAGIPNKPWVYWPCYQGNRKQKYIMSIVITGSVRVILL